MAFILPHDGMMDCDKDDFLLAAGDPWWIATSEWDGKRLSRLPAVPYLSAHAQCDVVKA